MCRCLSIFFFYVLCMYVCLSVSVSVCVLVCFVFVCIYLFVSVCASGCLCVYVCICMLVCVYMCMLCARLSLCMLCLFVNYLFSLAVVHVVLSIKISFDNIAFIRNLYFGCSQIKSISIILIYLFVYLIVYFLFLVVKLVPLVPLSSPPDIFSLTIFVNCQMLIVTLML